VSADRLVQAHARRAAEAASTMPRLSVSRAVPWREEAALLAALDATLRGDPVINAAWRDGRPVPHDDVRIAVQLPGPVAPVVRAPWNVGALRARDPQSFTAAELAGATFTVVLAPEADTVEPLLVPRQAAVLGAGRSWLTLACDARAVPVEAAAAFLAAL
jgi:hypothetical protein